MFCRLGKKYTYVNERRHHVQLFDLFCLAAFFGALAGCIFVVYALQFVVLCYMSIAVMGTALIFNLSPSPPQAAVFISQGQARHRLEFMIGDHVLPYNMTVYQAIRQYSNCTDREGSETDTDTENPVGHASVWVQTHTIW